jgi:hypothetical protein
MRSNAISIDAPIDGWDAFHSLDNMPATAAIVLDNLIPSSGEVLTRPGTIEYIDLGTGVPCETVASLDSATDSKLVAASGGGIWDITDSPEVTTAAIDVEELAPVGTFNNDRWQTSNFRKADESGILIMVNGSNDGQVYTPGTPGVLEPLLDTDLVGVDFIGVTVFKGRCYYWKDEDDAFYYTEAGAYQGTYSRFPLGAFVKNGGKLVSATSWTQQDSGDGKDDFIVFIFSTGEILIYQGDDPGGVGFFEMVGRYKTAPVLSVRGDDEYGTDVVIMTRAGYVNLSSIVQKGTTSDVPQFSRLINRAIQKETRIRSELFGWDCKLFPRAGIFVFNVPLSETDFNQHIFNTVTERWCRFTNINVNCLAVHNNRMFGGTSDGRVLALFEGTSDEGVPIQFTALYAFNTMGDPGNNTHLCAAQVLTTHSAPDYISLTGYANFAVPVLKELTIPDNEQEGNWSVNPAQPASPIGSYWDEDYWAVGGTVTTKGWQNCSAYGYSVALLVRFAKVNSSVSWRSTNMRFWNGGAQ